MVTYVITECPISGYCVDAYRDNYQYRYWKDEIEQLYLLYGRDAALINDAQTFGILTDELKERGLLSH